MFVIVSRHARDAQRLDQRLSIVRELVNRVHAIIDDPNVFFRIVRIDRHRMRTAELVIPLVPDGFLDVVALRVHHEHAVLPARVHSHLALPSVPAVVALIARTSQRANRRVAQRRLRDGERQAGAELRHGRLRRALHHRKLTAHQDENAIRIFSEDALHRSEGPFIVTLNLRERLGPIGDNIVSAGEILPAFLPRHGGESRGARVFPNRCGLTEERLRRRSHPQPGGCKRRAED